MAERHYLHRLVSHIFMKTKELSQCRMGNSEMSSRGTGEGGSGDPSVAVRPTQTMNTPKCTCPEPRSFGHEPECPLLAQIAEERDQQESELNKAHGAQLALALDKEKLTAENARLRGRIKAWELSMPLNPKWDWLKEEMNKEAGPTVPIDSEEARLREQLDKAHGAQLRMGLENDNLGKQRDGLKYALQDIAEFWHGDRDPLVLRHVCEHDRRVARHVLSALANVRRQVSLAGGNG